MLVLNHIILNRIPYDNTNVSICKLSIDDYEMNNGYKTKMLNRFKLDFKDNICYVVDNFGPFGSITLKKYNDLTCEQFLNNNEITIIQDELWISSNYDEHLLSCCDINKKCRSRCIEYLKTIIPNLVFI
jgi:hypothetical protein